MSIKSNFISFLQEAANHTSELDIIEDVLPNIRRKPIKNTAHDALHVGAAVRLLGSLDNNVINPESKTLFVLHKNAKEIFEKKYPNKIYEVEIQQFLDAYWRNLLDLSNKFTP